MPLDKAAAGDLPIDVDKPELVHEESGRPPGFLVKGEVIAFEEDDSVVGGQGDRGGDRILDGVVERGGIDCGAAGGGGGGGGGGLLV